MDSNPYQFFFFFFSQEKNANASQPLGNTPITFQMSADHQFNSEAF